MIRTRWKKWIMPVGLILALVLGWAWPAPGRYLNGTPAQTIAIVLLFLISGLELHIESWRSVSRLWLPALLGVISILFITPPFAFVYRYLPVDSFVAVGLGIFALAPTTVSSGAVFVSQCGGNMPLALFLTVATNILCVFTIPFMLPVFVIGASAVKLDSVAILIQLLYTVLCPTIVGKFARSFGAVRIFATRYKEALKLASIGLLILIPWMKMSSSVDSFNKISIVQHVLTASLALFMHLVFIGFHAAVTFSVPVSTDIRKAIVIMCSQKTLTVSFAVIASLPPSPISSLLSIPVIIGHLMQMIFDSILVAKWAGAPAIARDEYKGRPENGEIEMG